MSAPLSGLRTAPQGCSHLVLRGAGAGEGRALVLPTRSREAAEAPTGPRGPHAQSEAWSPAPVLCAPAGRQGRCPRPAEARSRPGHSQLCGVVLPEVREPRPASLRGRRARHPARGHAARAVALARLVGRFPAPRAPCRRWLPSRGQAAALWPAPGVKSLLPSGDQSPCGPCSGRQPRMPRVRRPPPQR